MARDTNQLTLSFLDTTSLSAGGLTLDAGYNSPRTPPSPAEPPDDEPAPASPSPPAIPARNFHLVGDRSLARGWKARAADNLASMRLALQIEDEKRNATPDEQEILCRFTGFGAGELANALFRRAGETFAAGWEDIGDQLEQLLPRDALASLSRSTQYAHFTPEFFIRAIWRAVQHMGFSGGPTDRPSTTPPEVRSRIAIEVPATPKPSAAIPAASDAIDITALTVCRAIPRSFAIRRPLRHRLLTISHLRLA